MQNHNGKKKRRRKEVSRRDFIKKGASTGTAMVAGFTGIKATDNQQFRAGNFFPFIGLDPAEQSGERGKATGKTERRAILFALGDTLIPSAPNDPGYRDLEWYGITAEVDRRLDELTDDNLEFFNDSSTALLKNRFTELPAGPRSQYLTRLLESGSLKDDSVQTRLQEIFSQVRETIFTVYYQNFPEDHWPRDAHRVPLLRPGDEHQITNPSSTSVVTGWDVAGYAGPLTWEEEERRRKFFKKINWIGG